MYARTPAEQYTVIELVVANAVAELTKGTSINFRQWFATSSKVQRTDLSRLEQMRTPRPLNDHRIGAAKVKPLFRVTITPSPRRDRGRPGSLAAGVPSRPLSHLELWVTANSKTAIKLRYLQSRRRSVQNFWKELYPPVSH